MIVDFPLPDLWEDSDSRLAFLVVKTLASYLYLLLCVLLRACLARLDTAY